MNGDAIMHRNHMFHLPSVCRTCGKSGTLGYFELNSDTVSQAWQGQYGCLSSQKLKYQDLLHKARVAKDHGKSSEVL